MSVLKNCRILFFIIIRAALAVEGRVIMLQLLPPFDCQKEKYTLFKAIAAHQIQKNPENSPRENASFLVSC